MKKLTINYFTLLSLLFFIACAPTKENDSEEQTQDALTISVKNPANMARPDEPILLTKAKLEQLTTSVPAGKVPYLKTSEGQDIPSQVDDLDGDGSWDELAALYSFEPNETVQISVEFVEPSALPQYPIRTNVRMALKGDSDSYQEVNDAQRTQEDIANDIRKPYQMEGPGWENDKVGFRLYFDNRNGKDIFGKTSTEMEMDRIVGMEGDYHAIADWGMDVLKVGNSLGAGALALKDSLNMYRVGSPETTQFKIISEGPVRSLFQLSYNNWQLDGETLQVKEVTSIWAGKYWYKSEVVVSGMTRPKNLVTGIVNLHSEEHYENKPNSFFVTVGTYDQQSENKDNLGMGLILNSSDFVVAGVTPEEGEGITQTFFVELDLENDKPVSYYFMAGWEKSEADFTSKDQFLAFLDNEANKMNQEIEFSK